ncbi:hypothetical protein B0A49_07059 [Cryomyces minteri]|uniref:Uncharacterized protein n=1 Tax=Cryomyces minteri TaxID=331657 RepID=A0A4U0WPP2_9PEZI|nr:hypothetical protein B0A49_07055 [Cryomyces minteri]TKA64154.1 hypothetical protein B0A49_07059 [Cryomyces minteri]
MSTSDIKSEKTFSPEIVAVLFMKIAELNGHLSSIDWEIMSAVDGTRSAGALEWHLRTTKKRGAELLAEKQAGKVFEGVAAKATPRAKKEAPGGVEKAAAETPAPSKKRGRSAKDDDDDSAAIAAPKVTKKRAPKKAKTEAVKVLEDEQSTVDGAEQLTGGEKRKSLLGGDVPSHLKVTTTSKDGEGNAVAGQVDESGI